MWSVIAAVVGVLGTGAAVLRLARKTYERNAQHYWFLGLGALFPAWLMAFLGLLQPLTKETADAPLPPRAIFSSGAALFGIIVTDYLLRRFQKSGRPFPAVTYWLLGWLALLPAWLIALVSF